MVLDKDTLPADDFIGEGVVEVDQFVSFKSAQIETGTDDVTDLGLIPATEAKPEDIGTLSLRYVDGQPRLVVSGGTVIPAVVPVVEGSRNTVAAYTAKPAAGARREAWRVPMKDDGANDGIYSATFIPPMDSSYRSAEATSGVTDLGAIQGTEGGPESPDLSAVPVTEIKPEDIGSLSLRYVDGVPQLVVSGGTAIPAGLTVVDGAGNVVAAYAAGPAVQATARFGSTVGLNDDGKVLAVGAPGPSQGDLFVFSPPLMGEDA